MKRVVALLAEGPRRIQSASAAPSCLREKERTVRRRAVAFHRAFPGRDAAGDLLLSDRTLREWTSRWRGDGLLSVSRGRPTTAASDTERSRMFGLLYLLGSETGFAVMKPYFPTLSRREGRSLLHRMRRLLRRLDREGELALEWLAPGSVWALDFTDPPAPIDGRFPHLLLVRDLASGRCLLSLPCTDETAKTAVDAVRSLFLELGAPLVMKADNGSAFIAELFRALAKEFGVTLLYSPPHYPAYNGSCEAGHGPIKTRSHHNAARAGRAGAWTCDDVEAARLDTNATARPRGLSGTTPDEAWNSKRAIEPTERARFREAVARWTADERSRRGFSPGTEPDPIELASVDRAGIARALTEQGLLQFKTKRFSPPILALFSAIFS